MREQQPTNGGVESVTKKKRGKEDEEEEDDDDDEKEKSERETCKLMMADPMEWKGGLTVEEAAS